MLIFVIFFAFLYLLFLYFHIFNVSSIFFYYIFFHFFHFLFTHILLNCKKSILISFSTCFIFSLISNDYNHVYYYLS